MTTLVTGGAGYIGGHVVDSLRAAGEPVVVIDDLSSGDADRLAPEIPFAEGSVLDVAFVTDVIRTYNVDGIVHLAAKKSVEESILTPLYYYRENVIGVLGLIESMVATGVRNIVYSSSAAVYGTPSNGLVTEDSPTTPVSPYGWTKLFGEQLLRDAGTAHAINWSALRYFNVGGASTTRLADRGSSNLIPKVFRAISANQRPRVFGDTYPTPDGTAVRDYIHVEDLSDAHVAVLRRMRRGSSASTYNIGTGTGASVLEVMRAVGRATSQDVRWEIAPPRPGDPAQVVADASKIYRELGWRTQRSLDDIIVSAWMAWSARVESDRAE